MVANGWMRFLVVALFLALPRGAGAQEAVLSGMVTDSTGGVLPGVTITAVHIASGNTFNSVTDTRGEYRMPARTGDYRVTAELAGFTTVTREVNVLVGQVARTTFQLAPSALEETVTVTGDAPLLNTTQSTLSGNIDRRQMESLPVNGRNWMGLALLAPGNTATAINESPMGASTRDGGMFQILLDGQEISQNITVSTGIGQSRVSRDAIQEFEFISNRFDVEYGRSAGVIIKAVTKSGTNAFAGSLSGYFRNDSFNAADFVAKRVLPYSNQQIAGTFGGPIRQDKEHFFAFYEYEREPQTYTWTTQVPAFNREISGTNSLKSGGGRFDQQFTSSTRMMIRGSWQRDFLPLAGNLALTDHPSRALSDRRISNSVVGTLTHVLDARTVNEIAVGYNHFHHLFDSSFLKPAHAPFIQLRELSFGKSSSTPRNLWEDKYSIRNNFTAYRSAAGTHDLKAGGEFIYMNVQADPLCNFCDPVIFANGGPMPANIAELFPVWDDWTTWNIAALSPIVTRYVQTVGEYSWEIPRQMVGMWVQDDWKPIQSLTLNLGVRSDFCTGCSGDDFEFPPLTLPETRKIQHWTVSPRVGFAYALPNNRTVIRGGSGRYYAMLTEHSGVTGANNNQTWAVDRPNDGRPNFAADPWNVSGGGKVPTFEELRASGLRREYVFFIMGPDARVPYVWQSSIGFQHELAQGLAVQADYVRADGRELFTLANRNLSCNPATGANYPFTDVSKRPYPNYGLLPYVFNDGKSESNALQTAITKRFSHGWQLSGTYTLSKSMDDTPMNGQGSNPDNVCDWAAEWAPSLGDQRHRVVLNGIWTLPVGFEVSGTYFYGSGEHFNTNYGGDLRNTGSASSGRLRPDGTVVPRNSFVGDPIHRVDVRLMRRFPLVGSATVDGILEVYNVFNHANYGSYVTSEVNTRYGQPVQNPNVAYAPRMLQLGFRVAF